MQLDINQLPQGKTKCKKVYVYCEGFKKRAREAKRQNFIVGYYPLTVKNVDLEADAKLCLQKEMKSLGKPDVTIKIQNHVIEILQHMQIHCFSSNDIFNAESHSFEVKL